MGEVPIDAAPHGGTNFAYPTATGFDASRAAYTVRWTRGALARSVIDLKALGRTPTSTEAVMIPSISNGVACSSVAGIAAS